MLAVENSYVQCSVNFPQAISGDVSVQQYRIK